MLLSDLLKMKIDRFHTSWVGSRPSVQRWLEQFVHYYTISARINHSIIKLC